MLGTSARPPPPPRTLDACLNDAPPRAPHRGGYPFRKSHKAFAEEYRWITRKADGWIPVAADWRGSPSAYCREVLSAVHQDFSEVRIGRTMMLYRSDAHRVLELLKNLALGRIFQQMQARDHPRPHTAPPPPHTTYHRTSHRHVPHPNAPHHLAASLPRRAPRRAAPRLATHGASARTKHRARAQAKVRIRIGREYRKLLRVAMDGLGRALAATRSLTTIGDAELRGMDAALETYHATLGRFGPIFAAFVPAVYEEMTNFKEVCLSPSDGPPRNLTQADHPPPRRLLCPLCPRRLLCPL